MTGAHHHSLPSEPEQRVQALEELLIRKGLVKPETLDAIIDHYGRKVGPMNGARVVAKAWTDNGFRARLLRDATAAVADLGLTGRQGEHITAVANTPALHNLVVCTLCSCYPWPLLGLPPTWYKSRAYRSRAVREPRRVLEEFGVDILPTQSVRVWDSTAEVRYLVVPMRPENTAEMSEAALAECVSRDSMIGAGLAAAG